MGNLLDDLVGSALSSSALERNIDTLAEARARCQYNLHVGRCSRESCVTCGDLYKLTDCYERLSACDQLRVDQKSDDMYLCKVLRADMARRDVKADRQARATGYLVPVLVGLGLLIMGRCVSAETMSDKIGRTVERTHSQVRDMNGDGKVNCVDWSLTFKGIWDDEFGEGTCRLVENHNGRTGMHHMFVKVCESREHAFIASPVWTYVEPQGSAEDWTLYGTWGRMYDPRYNE